jgi:hypothetical protein
MHQIELTVEMLHETIYENKSMSAHDQLALLNQETALEQLERLAGVMKNISDVHSKFIEDMKTNFVDALRNLLDSLRVYLTFAVIMQTCQFDFDLKYPMEHLMSYEHKLTFLAELSGKDYKDIAVCVRRFEVATQLMLVD